MSNATRGNKNLLIIIAVLLLTNIAVLGYFLWYKKAPEKTDRDNKNGIADMLQKQVGFSDAQIAQYKMMKDKQRETIRPMYDDMRKAKDSLFGLITGPEVSDSVADLAADKIAQRQKALDLQTFKYFKQVRALCTPEQMPKYDTLIQNMFSKMVRPARHQDNDGPKKK